MDKNNGLYTNTTRNKNVELKTYVEIFTFSQNGYQGQKRNIVDDAKFETKVNEEEKRNWINLVRRKSQGMCS